MTYSEFKEALLKDLARRFPAGTSIAVQQITHNNQTASEALTILEPELNISPSIYLESYYKRYESGTPFSSVSEEIYGYYQKYRASSPMDTSFFTSFEQVRSRIVYKLVHFQKNKELLNEVPHIPYLDLAIVFYYLLAKAPYENASILIHNQHLIHWNISVDTLFALAKENTPFLLSSCCDSLTELLLPVMEHLSGQEQEEALSALQASRPVPMYVLTNQQRFLGACCILYDNVLKEIAAHLDSDLYILPSSIHEVILIPANVTESAAALSQMVSEINQSEVSPEEVLSNHIYYYHRLTDRITM